jgi:hypothetical protein
MAQMRPPTTPKCALDTCIMCAIVSNILAKQLFVSPVRGFFFLLRLLGNYKIQSFNKYFSVVFDDVRQ